MMIFQNSLFGTMWLGATQRGRREKGEREREVSDRPRDREGNKTLPELIEYVSQ